MPAAAIDYLESLLRERKLDHTLTDRGLTPVPGRGQTPYHSVADTDGDGRARCATRGGHPPRSCV